MEQAIARNDCGQREWPMTCVNAAHWAGKNSYMVQNHGGHFEGKKNTIYGRCVQQETIKINKKQYIGQTVRKLPL